MFLHSTSLATRYPSYTRQVFVNLFSSSTVRPRCRILTTASYHFVSDVHSWHRTLRSCGGTWAYHLCVTMRDINIHRTIWSLSFRAGILMSCQLIVRLLTLLSITTITRHCSLKTDVRVRILHDRNLYLSSHCLSVFVSSHQFGLSNTLKTCFFSIFFNVNISVLIPLHLADLFKLD